MGKLAKAKPIVTIKPLILNKDIIPFTGQVDTGNGFQIDSLNWFSLNITLENVGNSPVD
jgi:hypothetical protein